MSTLNPRQLEELTHRFAELNGLLSDPSVIQDPNRFRQLAKEQAKLEPVATQVARYQDCQQALHELDDLDDSNDPEWQALAQQERQSLQAALKTLEAELQVLLLPTDPHDDHNVYLEIRAGTGGDEAALFAGVLLRMYQRYAQEQGWQCICMSQHEGEQGGFKEVICHVVGDDVYAKLKFESGVHRVQRVPATESQGRVHTSACTVAILPETDDIDDVDIQPQDLRIDTYRSSGAGGQHVNTTDSAVRITHLPTGVVVECQDERSQHKNKAKAMHMLKNKILARAQAEQQQLQACARKSLVGSGDRSERIRTYNFPQGRVTDHRIQLTLYRLEAVLEGELEAVIGPLQQAHQAALLAET